MENKKEFVGALMDVFEDCITKQNGKFQPDEELSEDSDPVYLYGELYQQLALKLADTIDHHAFCKNDYLAWKLWTEDDIKAVLLEYGYAGTDEQIGNVIQTGQLDTLNDRTDCDWEIIRNACNAAGYNER